MIGPTNALTVTGTVDPGSVTVGSNLKPVKLVSGVATAVDNDLVDTASAQDIRGNKVFYDRPTFDYWNPVLRLNAGHAIGFNVQLNVDEYNVAPGADKVYSQTVFDKNNVQEAKLQYFHGTSGTKDWRLHVTKNDGTDVFAELLRSLPDGTTYSTSPWRGSANYPSMGTDEVITRGALQASTDVVHRSGNEDVSGFKTFTEPILGAVSLMRNKNINGVSVKVGLASGTGAYKYGSAFYIVTVRDNLYLVSMSSGSSATKHDAISVINMTTFTQSNISNLEWKMGYYIDGSSNIFVTITGPSANRICNVHFLGGSQGGGSGLIVRPTSNDYVDTASVTQFW